MVSDKIQQLIKPGLNQDQRILFFTGKGGVGKTAASSATAYWLAQEGYETLLVTTDPADHLSKMFSIEVESDPKSLEQQSNLSIARVDQEKALEEYKEKILSEAREKYGEKRLQAVKEELNSPCTEEMAAFQKFISFVTEDAYDVIIFDTAPTGHTLRLLELPMDWDDQMEVMVANEFKEQTDSEKENPYQEVIDLLRNPEITSFVFVVYPENTPIMEAYRASEDLEEAGIETSLVVANKVLLPEYCTTDFFKKRYKLQQKHFSRIKELFGTPVVSLPLLNKEIKGLETLKKAGKLLWEKNNNMEGLKDESGG